MSDHKNSVFVTVTLEADVGYFEDVDRQTYDPSEDFESLLQGNTPFVNYEIHEIKRDA